MVGAHCRPRVKGVQTQGAPKLCTSGNCTWGPIPQLVLVVTPGKQGGSKACTLGATNSVCNGMLRLNAVEGIRRVPAEHRKCGNSGYLRSRGYDNQARCVHTHPCEHICIQGRVGPSIFPLLEPSLGLCHAELLPLGNLLSPPTSLQMDLPRLQPVVCPKEN